MLSDNDDDESVNLSAFLLVLIRDWIILGAVSSVGLEWVFNAWEHRTGNKAIASYDKGLISLLAPACIASAAYLLLCAIGSARFSFRQLANTVYLGFRTAIGAQGMYNFYKKYLEDKVLQTFITNIGSVDSKRDVFIGSTINEV